MKKKIYILIIVSALFNSCAGVLAIHPNVKKEEKVSPYVHQTEKNELILNGENNYTKAFVLDGWGEPVTIETIGNEQTWEYKKNKRWRGVVIFALIPVPFVLPVGESSINLKFEDEVLKEIVVKDYGVTGFLCGIFGGDTINPWCFVKIKKIAWVFPPESEDNYL